MAMNSDKNDNGIMDKYEGGRRVAIFMAGAVYAGVVIAATVMFITFILSAFPPEAYFSRFVMMLAGGLVGGSMIAFPFALHNWAVQGRHRMITAFLYYGEIFIIGLNTIVSFAHLLNVNAGRPAPAWVLLYEPFSVFSIVYTLFAWGTVFLTDPIAAAKDKEIATHQRFRARLSAKKEEFLDSIQGEDVIEAAASEEIWREFNPENHVQRGRRQFGSGRGATLWTCDNCGKLNPPSADYCKTCGHEKPGTPHLPAGQTNPNGANAGAKNPTNQP